MKSNESDTSGVSVTSKTPTDTDPSAYLSHAEGALRRVPGKIPWAAWLITVLQFCERFSFMGSIVVVVNFVQKPLPPGSVTGAGHSGQSGALGFGQRTMYGLGLFTSFWLGITPLLGAFVADQYLGRYKTVQLAIIISLTGHLVLLMAAIPPIIVRPSAALACVIVALVLMGVGVGAFKPNISTLIADQVLDDKPGFKVLASGEGVLVDSKLTRSRLFNYQYALSNLGTVAGSASMVFAEKYVGYWLAFMLPTIVYTMSSIVFLASGNRYKTARPESLVVGNAVRLCALAMKGKWSLSPLRLYRNIQDPNFWTRVKPSNIQNRLLWMTFDDSWVDEVCSGLRACKLFLWFPVYWLALRQMFINMTAQAATLNHGGVPNDFIAMINPITCILLVPIFTKIIYPALERKRIEFSLVNRIAVGFLIASLAMVGATITQLYTYTTHPCGHHPNDKTCKGHSPISVWVQFPSYFLVAISEILAAITGISLAYEKAPSNMRSLIMAIFCFSSTGTAALGQAFVPLSEDPYLVWNYATTGMIIFFAAVGFWICNRKMDEESERNACV